MTLEINQPRLNHSHHDDEDDVDDDDDDDDNEYIVECNSDSVYTVKISRTTCTLESTHSRSHRPLWHTQLDKQPTVGC